MRSNQLILINASLTGAPKITSDLSIRDMVVIAGEEFTITVPFTGSPLPKPVWSVNGEEIIPDSRIKFETSANETVFKNKCAKRKTDTGNYTIHLINNIGADSASCKVLVVGEFLPAYLYTGVRLFFTRAGTLPGFSVVRLIVVA